jgi:hypothetical protein
MAPAHFLDVVVSISSTARTIRASGPRNKSGAVAVVIIGAGLPVYVIVTRSPFGD